ncbi:MAG TPA: arginine--tRNA ligase [Terriglobales bacterium]|nr:arginine--tRNA ligase [Terriglobales bacterium]
MYLELEQRLRAAMLEHLRYAYAWTPPQLVVEDPPRPELGDFALPLSFELAKQLRRPPRQIALEIATAFALPEGMARVEVAGAGYLNFFVDRGWAWSAVGRPALAQFTDKVIVEHTNINPNKSAHIGHLRNAVLGDTWVRLLRHQGETVEVQNLQDNTGVQVADVVAAFLYLGDAAGDVAAATARVEAAIADAGVRFDYLCWDLYAAISQHYEQHPENLKAWRPAALHAIEAGDNAVAHLAGTISSAIAHCHLRTLDRIGVRYDLLPRESEILRLRLWEHAFRLLRERGAVRLETEGKNKDCWVMDRAEARGLEGEEETKVIVRSNGTVTYVGKDIAYQLWKFGLLPLEFGFVPFHVYPDGATAWTTATESAPGAPAFGRGEWVFNVIDARQSYLQEIVAAGLRALDFQQQAERSVHFSYEMVALSAACATELGYAPAAGDKRVDVSGRKGTGVKADDLIDRLLARTLDEVTARHPEASEPGRQRSARQIAVGALRYFLLKFTRSTVIAFDFKDALSFEGETGPYVQYAAVRAANILTKAGELSAPSEAGSLADNQLWSLFWLASRLDAVVDQAIAAQEPAFLAKYAFQLAQGFNVFYHHTPVLQEGDAARRAFLLALVARVHRQLAAALELMGIETPDAM